MGTNYMSANVYRPKPIQPFLRGLFKFGLGQSHTEKFLNICKNSKHAFNQANSKLNVVAEEFARQTHGVLSLRLRRSIRAIHLSFSLGYGRYLSSRAFQNNYGRGGMKSRKLSSLILFGAAFFSWDEERITADEITEMSEEMTFLPHKASMEVKIQKLEAYLHGWERVISKPTVVAWRRLVSNTQIFEYKVFGSYSDVPARAFFNAQLNIEYRKNWDNLIKSLDVVDREKATDSEVLRWVSHFPFPFWSREYVYIRRSRIDLDKKVMIVMNRNVDHPACPEDSRKYVRVTSYQSTMVIRPHSTFDENGFDYILSYYDDPQAVFPSACYNWLATTGVPDFVDQMHTFAKRLHEIEKGYETADSDNQDCRKAAL